MQRQGQLLPAYVDDALEPPHQKSLADPEANMLRVGNDGALTYACNAQAAASEDGVIVAVGRTTSVADTPQAVPMGRRGADDDRGRPGLHPDGQGASAAAVALGARPLRETEDAG